MTPTPPFVLSEGLAPPGKCVRCGAQLSKYRKKKWNKRQGWEDRCSPCIDTQIREKAAMPAFPNTDYERKAQRLASSFGFHFYRYTNAGKIEWRKTGNGIGGHDFIVRTAKTPQNQDMELRGLEQKIKMELKAVESEPVFSVYDTERDAFLNWLFERMNVPATGVIEYVGAMNPLAREYYDKHPEFAGTVGSAQQKVKRLIQESKRFALVVKGQGMKNSTYLVSREPIFDWHIEAWKNKHLDLARVVDEHEPEKIPASMPPEEYAPATEEMSPYDVPIAAEDIQPVPKVDPEIERYNAALAEASDVLNKGEMAIQVLEKIRGMLASDLIQEINDLRVENEKLRAAADKWIFVRDLLKDE